MFLGLRTATYHVGDITRAKDWYTDVLGVRPYFDEPFYVGFDVGGYELGLLPEDAEVPRVPTGAIAYWGVDDADAAHERLLGLGATENGGIRDVGGDIRIGTVLDPFGNAFGVVDNPHFSPQST